MCSTWRWKGSTRSRQELQSAFALSLHQKFCRPPRRHVSSPAERRPQFQPRLLANSRGDVVGDKTFGEGSVQKLIEVPDGSALILSIAKYYTSNGKVIQDTGITPNILVASTDDAVVLSEDDDNSYHEEPQKTQPKEDDQ